MSLPSANVISNNKIFSNTWKCIFFIQKQTRQCASIVWVFYEMVKNIREYATLNQLKLLRLLSDMKGPYTSFLISLHIFFYKDYSRKIILDPTCFSFELSNPIYVVTGMMAERDFSICSNKSIEWPDFFRPQLHIDYWSVLG